ncbi:hypothetical protein MTBPR1_200021 [Candidatus Terasakiella magnetica]|uniref:Uncharacterized protein n=1 Tax=Candidatus Terasakiella magnetica TaxID=1867952 RepID=A0A1C3RGX7_9PROT|nr:hypothetical protein [Candidatus Terasakiella magnetica]SCA56541.1 hypothetical protein MTBPR1_200021 [Candidatus Terasakiella magnetica]
MNFNADEILKNSEALIPPQQLPWFHEGIGDGIQAFRKNKRYDPELIHFVNDDQKRAYVKGYTTAIRIEHELSLDAVRELEAIWDYPHKVEVHPNQNKFDDFIAKRSTDIPCDFKIHFERGFNMTCYDKKREHFFTDEQKSEFLSQMNEAFSKGAEAGYDAQCDNFEGTNKFQTGEVWGEL